MLMRPDVGPSWFGIVYDNRVPVSFTVVADVLIATAHVQGLLGCWVFDVTSTEYDETLGSPPQFGEMKFVTLSVALP